MYFLIHKVWRLVLHFLVISAGSFLFANPALCEQSATPPRTAFDSLGFFEKDFATKDLFKSGRFEGTVQKLEQEVPEKALKEDENLLLNEEEIETDSARKPYKPVFVSNDPSSHITSPHERAQVRLNPEMPGPFLGMATAYQQGDVVTAFEYAKQMVQYQLDVIFQARALSDLMGQAMVSEGRIDEEDYIGISQRREYLMAQGRGDSGAPVRPKHEDVMKRIEPDKKGEVEVYYFFTLNCSWCRLMAPDVERLWRATKRDRKVKMVALTLGETPVEWVESYREYTGMTLPIMDGTKVAKAFYVGFVPAVVVVVPNTKRAYVKTGQQSFERLYEFIRTAQGLPATLTPKIQKIARTPIGQVEIMKLAQKSGDSLERIQRRLGGKTKTSTRKRQDYSLERF